jgi:molecular chaperone DnaJ
MGEDIETQVSISFMEAAKGVTKKINISHLIKCGTCDGSGLKSGVTKSTCKSCNGSGSKVHSMGGFQVATTCDTCGGSGVSKPKGGECRPCHGNGVTQEQKTVTIDIPGGVEDGMRLKVSGEGNMPPLGQAEEANPRGQAGDLLVLIRVAADSKFQRKGSDILYTASIPFTTAILGGEIKIPTLDGFTTIKVPTGTGTGEKVILGGMGMTQLNSRRGTKGDLRVEFKVTSPKYLSANQRTVAEMLAEEMGDVTAKRTMIKRRNTESPEEQKESHDNEGFLKSAWHTITGKHAHLDKSTTAEAKDKPESKDQSELKDKPKVSESKTEEKDDEKKKASG